MVDVFCVSIIDRMFNIDFLGAIATICQIKAFVK